MHFPGGHRIYCSADSKKQKRQSSARQIHQANMTVVVPQEMSVSVSVALAGFFSSLNEKQRQLFAALLSLFIGHGGDTQISKLLGINRKTIRSGKRDLKSGNVIS